MVSPPPLPPLSRPEPVCTGISLYRVHGGSFISGSASAPGLSGAKLATEGNIIVVVPQYRIGVFGFLPPSTSKSAADPNLGMGDLVLALKSIRTYIRDFGGDGGKVVLGGQSSGAHMLRGGSCKIGWGWS
jgi:carboxylesterase type B